MIGDSGEQDPEIYAKVAEKYAERVVGVFIRNVTGETIDDSRFVAVQKQLGGVRLELFDEPDSLLPVIQMIEAKND